MALKIVPIDLASDHIIRLAESDKESDETLVQAIDEAIEKSECQFITRGKGISIFPRHFKYLIGPSLFLTTHESKTPGSGTSRYYWSERVQSKILHNVVDQKQF